MKITDLIEMDNLLCDPNNDLTPYTGKVEGNVKGELIDEMFNGGLIEFFENGNIREKKNYNNGILNGEYNYYYSNGEIKEDKFYVDGRLEGNCFNYYSSGRIWIKSQYKHGKLERNREVYFESGKLEKAELYERVLRLESNIIKA